MSAGAGEPNSLVKERHPAVFHSRAARHAVALPISRRHRVCLPGAQAGSFVAGLLTLRLGRILKHDTFQAHGHE